MYPPGPSGPPPASPPPPPPPPGEAVRRPTRVEPVPGTPYGLAIFGAPPVTSGPAVGALVAGVAALLVSLVVACFGLADAAASGSGGAGGWGALVGGAFGVLTGFLGTAGVGLGIAGIRQSRGTGPAGERTVRGRGMAIAGMVCGAVAVAIAGCSLGVAILATVG